MLPFFCLSFHREREPYLASTVTAIMDTILIESGDENITDEIKHVIDLYQKNLFIYDQPLNAILISTYVPLFLIALTSNIAIILVVRRYQSLQR